MIKNCPPEFRMRSDVSERTYSEDGEPPFLKLMRAGKLPRGCSMVETEPAKQLAAAPKPKPVAKPSSTPTPQPTGAEITAYRAEADGLRAQQARLTKQLARIADAADRPKLKPKRFSFGKALSTKPAPRVPRKLSGMPAKIRVNGGLFHAFKTKQFGVGGREGCTVEEAAGKPKPKSAAAKPKAKRKRKGLRDRIAAGMESKS